MEKECYRGRKKQRRGVCPHHGQESGVKKMETLIVQRFLSVQVGENRKAAPGFSYTEVSY